MIELVLRDTTYDARSALFVTGVKDLETAQAWAGPGRKLYSIEKAVRQIGEMSEAELVAILKSLIAKGERDAGPSQ